MVNDQVPSETMRRAFDLSLVLYTEHELNASTFAARVTVSTLSDLHSGVVAAIGTLKGPLHGGANEEAWKVLEEVGSPENAERWIHDALARKERIMGFGHRVYKTGDPRARILQEHCARLAAEIGDERWERIAEPIERAVTAQKHLPPNVDWPSARLYHYMNLDIDLYTPIFAMARVAGWSAHIIEQLDHNRLMRPRGRYVGPPNRATSSRSTSDRRRDRGRRRGTHGLLSMRQRQCEDRAKEQDLLHGACHSCGRSSSHSRVRAARRRWGRAARPRSSPARRAWAGWAGREESASSRHRPWPRRGPGAAP